MNANEWNPLIASHLGIERATLTWYAIQAEAAVLDAKQIATAISHLKTEIDKWRGMVYIFNMEHAMRTGLTETFRLETLLEWEEMLAMWRTIDTAHDEPT